MWGNRINFLFMDWQTRSITGIFTSRLPKNSTKSWYRKPFNIVKEKNLYQMSLPDRLICFENFVGLILHACLSSVVALRFPLALRSCFLRVCVPPLLAANLKFSRPPTTSAISGRVNFNRTAPTRFATGTFQLRKIGKLVLLIKLWKCVSFPPLYRPRPLLKGICIWFNATIVKRLCCYKWMLQCFLSVKTRWVVPLETEGFSPPYVSLMSLWLLWKNIWAVAGVDLLKIC